MKKRKAVWMLAVCAGVFLLSGCGGKNQKIYEQAEKDFRQGSYEYALQGYQTSAANGWKTAESWRGVGICQMRMGNDQDAIGSFTNALEAEKAGEGLKKDVLSYRATAEWNCGLYEDAMADCQTLAEEYSMDADIYYLTGRVALSMDAYNEASLNFEQVYGEDSTYDRAIQIYEAYLERGMEADGTRYLEAALLTEPKSSEDYCDRGRVYYYMEDYASAQQELIKASNDGSTEALLLLGNVYFAQGDTSNARSMYQEYISKENSPAAGYNGLVLCDIAEGKYGDALTNISNGLPYSSTGEMQNLLYNEIVVYEKQLDYAAALQKAREYQEMFPEDKSIAKEIIFLKSRVTTASADTPVVESDAAAETVQ